MPIIAIFFLYICFFKRLVFTELQQLHENFLLQHVQVFMVQTVKPLKLENIVPGMKSNTHQY